MRENLMDIATDILKERITDANLVIKKMYKGTNPYRMEPKSDTDRIAEYNKWAGTPMEGELRQQMGDQEIDKIHFNMQELNKKLVMRNA